MDSDASPTPGSPRWWAQVEAPTGGRGRPPVPVARIVAAGLELLDDADGPEYSVRNVASRLGSSTATLYRRLGGRPGLDALIVDHVLGEAVGETVGEAAHEDADWQEASAAGAEAIFTALARHPGVVPLLAADVPRGPNSALLRERFVARLLDAGFAPSVAARTYTTVAHVTVGFALQLTFAAPPAGGGDGGDGKEGAAEPDPHYPATAQVAQHLDADLREEFTFGLSMLLKGIAESR
ncbi:TetR/AcrR family transcriptional regulator [Corynebacterium sp. AOP40-9SA-29]|uniref:TetR/AcrR family transcriptional regulator n=1 Tax=Corynebacterium sp. AOP40-9SA-29 TaxID=3457677 RepID=UPI004033CD2D